MDFLHVEIPSVSNLSCVALNLQGNSLLPHIVSLYSTNFKEGHVGMIFVFHKSLLPLPAPLSHLCELLFHRQVLMTLEIRFDYKQSFSHVFQLALYLLSWV